MIVDKNGDAVKAAVFLIVCIGRMSHMSKVSNCHCVADNYATLIPNRKDLQDSCCRQYSQFHNSSKRYSSHCTSKHAQQSHHANILQIYSSIYNPGGLNFYYDCNYFQIRVQI